MPNDTSRSRPEQAVSSPIRHNRPLGIMAEVGRQHRQQSGNVGALALPVQQRLDGIGMSEIMNTRVVGGRAQAEVFSDRAEGPIGAPPLLHATGFCDEEAVGARAGAEPVTDRHVLA